MFILLRRLRARLKYRHFERDLEQELDVHRAMKEDELHDAGLEFDEVRRRSRRELGNTTYMREEARRVRLGGAGITLDQLRSDLLDAARSLRRSPAFTVVSVGVLALGIGLNAAIFSVVKAVFLPVSSVPSPSTLVYVTADKAIDLRGFRLTTQHVLTDFAYHGRPREELFVVGPRAAKRAGEQVSANYFEVVGIRAVMGRTFSRAEDDIGNPARAVVISHALWTDQFDADASVVGRTVLIGARTFTVIGVMPADFDGLSAPWFPTTFWMTRAQSLAQPNPSPEAIRIVNTLSSRLVARLKPGVSIRQATIAASLQTPVEMLPSTDAPIAFASDGESAPLTVVASTTMAVGLMLLLIAGTNITGVLSARGVSREREFAVRQALGAGGWRIIQQRLLESLLLAAGGGIAGVGVAAACISLYRAYSPSELVYGAPLDFQVLAYILLVCLGSGVVIGLTPALRARRPELLTALGGGVGAGLPMRSRRRLQYGVLVPQILTSVVLLMVGGVYGTTLLRMEVPEPGYGVEDVTVATYTYADITPPAGRVTTSDYGVRRRVFDELLVARLRQSPGVTDAALSSRLPSDHMGINYNRWIGTEAGATVPGTGAEGNRVSPRYFSTLSIPLLRGRDFANADVTGAPAVAIVSESFARALWPDADPIGRSFVRLNQNGSRGGDDYAQQKQVIGIVADTRSPLQTESQRLSFYIPLRQSDIGSPDFTIFLVASGSSAAVTNAIHTAVTADPSAHVLTVESMGDTIAREMYPFRAAAWLFGLTGFAGIFLAAMGLYGVVAHSVAQQTREFGIRAALGATRSDIARLVLSGGTTTALLAGVPGLVVAFLVLRAANSWVQMAPVIDPLTIAGILTFIVIVVLGACYVPARRAARVNPADTLRAE
jgi:predicted permease